MSVAQVEVNGEKYNIAQAPAEKQLELYEMLFARTLANFVMSKAEKINADIIKGILASSPKGTISAVADIVLAKAVKHGMTHEISIRDFQGNIDAFVSLVSEGVCVNLADFFGYIESQATEARKETEKAKEEAANRL
jgi:hypothetical protein